MVICVFSGHPANADIVRMIDFYFGIFHRNCGERVGGKLKISGRSLWFFGLEAFNAKRLVNQCANLLIARAVLINELNDSINLSDAAIRQISDFV